MFFLKKFSIIALLVAIASCNNPTSENFNARMSALEGQHIDIMVPQWGPPHSEYTYQDGSRVYKWHNSVSDEFGEVSGYPGTGVSTFSHWPSSGQRLMSYGGGYYGGYPFSPFYHNFVVYRPMTLTHHCTLLVTTDKNGIIRKHEAIGDNCVSN